MKCANFRKIWSSVWLNPKSENLYSSKRYVRPGRGGLYIEALLFLITKSDRNIDKNYTTKYYQATQSSQSGAH